MKRKLFRSLAVVLLLGLTIAGCGQPTETVVPADEGAAPPDTETVTITIWDFGGSEFGWMDNIAIPKFEEKFPNITINHVGVLEDELGLKLETAIAAGEVPDLAIFVPSRVIAAGHVLALDDYMARDGIKREDYCPLFESWNVFTGGKIENKVTSLPIDTNIWAMLYNKDLFAEAGLPELRPDDVINFDTWLEYARAINKPAESLEDRVWGSNMFEPVFNAMNNYMSSPYVLGDDGRSCEGNANNADWTHAWEVMVTAYNEDLTPLTGSAMLADVEEDMFVQGKIGMTYAALGDALYAREQGLNVGLAGQPVVTDGWEGNVGGWNGAYSIMAASQHPDEAWEFLKYISTEAPLVIPLGSDSLDSDLGGMPGLPCYLPLLEQGAIAEMIANDPLVADSVELMQRVQPPPFTPDIWTSVDAFWGIFTMVTEEGMDVQTAVNQATVECQDATDQLWDVFDALGD
ncbi:MAG: extracellular solute-binding protein [Anaerolineae bacterium]|nr:extracellular solute-binding protein [Anaerolineae bacterium]